MLLDWKEMWGYMQFSGEFNWYSSFNPEEDKQQNIC